jgi:hypothetical protein
MLPDESKAFALQDPTVIPHYPNVIPSNSPGFAGRDVFMTPTGMLHLEAQLIVSS